MKRLTLPTGAGPWSWRLFDDEPSAHTFYQRLLPGHPEPFAVNEDILCPAGGKVIRAGTWIVLYRPIIFPSDDQPESS